MQCVTIQLVGILVLVSQDILVMDITVILPMNVLSLLLNMVYVIPMLIVPPLIRVSSVSAGLGSLVMAELVLMLMSVPLTMAVVQLTLTV